MLPSITCFPLTLSRMLIIYLLLIHGFALVCCWMSFDALIFVMCCIFLTISFFFFLKKEMRIYQMHPHVSLIFSSGQQWKIHFSAETIQPVWLLKKSVLATFFCILHFRATDSNKRFVFLIFPDSVPAMLFRVLKRCVRMSEII